MEVKAILDEIQALSNERQRLWYIANRDKFSRDWWQRHDKIEVIGKRLARLWHMHRIELAEAQRGSTAVTDRIHADHFADYRARAGVEPDGEWRIEDETNTQHRYMSVEKGFIDNQQSDHLKKQTPKRSERPNIGARKRNRAIQGMIQLS